ncbi:hypothetical protein GNP61_17435 [Aliivibrio fischeri]|uniref:hypothetical protein n=1 Tax=Aliivibrio fischeri TaxID=668 RepID=UPI0012DA162C|nr:hypothetical protein [Aliivibrio fischeri]MUK43330.1 hypothetical protein [Aliivibrio fischeri]
MEIQKYINMVLDSLKVAIPSIFIGVVGTYIVYDSIVLVAKNSEISTLRASVEVEKGRQNVLNERIKLWGDKTVFLQDQLRYKPALEKAEKEKSTALIKKLTEENLHLQKLKASFETAEGSQIELAQLNVKLEKYISENEKLKKSLAKFDSDIIVDNYRLNEGQSWSGFGGQVTFGISKISREYDDGNIALAVSSIFKTDSQVVKAGNSFKFQINKIDYNLVVNTINYVGDYSTISVYKKI